jgi:alkylation response protein AidB-like acyl-CoA dehydrogenase
MIQLTVIGEEFATECAGLAQVLLAHYLGFVPILLFGDVPALQRHLIPLYLRRRRGAAETMAFAITEPGAGSGVEDTIGGTQSRLVTTVKPAKGGYRLVRCHQGLCPEFERGGQCQTNRHLDYGNHTILSIPIPCY